jgi:hypothetical protein
VNVQIEELDCESNPEVIVIRNLGDQEVAMTGWNLQSDPTNAESLPLSQFGSLSAGETVEIKAGPSAEAGLVWSRQFVFRDNDPSDFAQLASDAGDVLLKVNCGSVQQPTATATAIPTALPAVNVPVGGGAPVAGAAGISPAVMIVAGSWLLAAGMATFAFPWRRSRGPGAPEETPPPEPAAAPLTQTVDRPDPPPSAADPLRTFLVLAVIVLALVALLAFLLQLGEKKEE